MSASKPMVLASSWHPGGINAIVPVIKKLMADGKTEVVVLGHEFSEPILAKAGISFKTIKDFGLSDVSPNSMGVLLQAVSPNLVLMGTSGQEGKANDILEHSLTLASRNLNIKSLAVIDVWGCYWQRFTDERTNRKLELLPDCVAILDEVAKEDMLKEGFPKDRLVITGNPHFDNLPARAKSFTEIQRSELKRKIGLDCETLFFLAGNGFSSAKPDCGYWDLDVIELILDTMSELPGVGLAVRVHPRMPTEDKRQVFDAIARSGTKAKLIEDIDSQTLALVADVTFCEFSTIGIEAVYMRRPTVSLQPGLQGKDNLLVSEKGIIPVGYTVEACRELIKKAVDPQYRADILNLSANFATDGRATERVVELVCSLLKPEEEVSMNRRALIKRRSELIHEMTINHPIDICKNLGPASDGEYEAYLKRYEDMKEELAKLNKQLGLPEDSWESLA